MVYYKSYGTPNGEYPSKDRAAVVTDVRERGAPDEVIPEVRLCVMNPEGLFFTGWLSQGQEGGQWDWMPYQKDQQARYAAQDPKATGEIGVPVIS